MLTTEGLAETTRYLGNAVSIDDLRRLQWRHQTDCVQQLFVAARLFADLGRDVLFIDGHIRDHEKFRALTHGLGVKGYFNRRFHDLDFTGRRMVFFDTRMTRAMGRRGSGHLRLHFHALIELPRGWTKAKLFRLLEKVFGKVDILGRRQFHEAKPEWEKHYTHNDVQVEGPLGKLAYVMDHAGTSYRDLDLNGGKQSRSAPRSRGRSNRQSSGLARGIPSNFNAEIVLIDAVSRRTGKEAFDAWVKAERAARRPVESAPAPAPAPVAASSSTLKRASQG